MPKKLTMEEFIEKARAVHGDRYDYSDVIYVNSNTKVTIVCHHHGEFEQTPNVHLSGRGCPVCGGTIRHTKDSFIIAAKSAHGDKYDYDKVIYVNTQTKVKIVCPEHGEFEQRPNTHLLGKGCLLCGFAATAIAKAHTKASFIASAKLTHGNRYIYDNVVYTRGHIKVAIVCPEHGVFEQKPANHLSGQGCPACAGNNTHTNETFIAAAKSTHGDKYRYDSVVYVNSKTKVKIICPEHGEFEQTPHDHLSGYGCPGCGGTMPHTNETFIAAAKSTHDDKYRYDSVVYVNSKTKVKIICPEHGEFEQTPADHLTGYGCRRCAGTMPYTKETFMAAAKATHGDKYIYENAEYTGCGTKVNIICPEHGLFKQTPASHLYGKGCSACSIGGFVNNKPGTLYCLRSEDGLYIKVGISNQYEQRIKRLKRATPFDFNVIELLHKNDGSEIRDLEQQFHKAYESANLTGFDGCTEWLRYHPDIPELINLMR